MAPRKRKTACKGQKKLTEMLQSKDRRKNGCKRVSYTHTTGDPETDDDQPSTSAKAMEMLRQRQAAEEDSGKRRAAQAVPEVRGETVDLTAAKDVPAVSLPARVQSLTKSAQNKISKLPNRGPVKTHNFNKMLKTDNECNEDNPRRKYKPKFYETNIKFPVTFTYFQKYVNYDHMIDEYIQRKAKNEIAAKQWQKDLDYRKLVLHRIYETYYARPENRMKFPIKFKPCPRFIRKKIIEIPAAPDATINIPEKSPEAQPQKEPNREEPLHKGAGTESSHSRIPNEEISPSTWKFLRILPELLPNGKPISYSKEEIFSPPTLEEFKSASHFNEPVEAILLEIAKGDESFFLKLKANKAIYDEVLEHYYYSYFQCRSTRQKYQLRLKACPKMLREKLLQSPRKTPEEKSQETQSQGELNNNKQTGVDPGFLCHKKYALSNEAFLRKYIAKRTPNLTPEQQLILCRATQKHFSKKNENAGRVEILSVEIVKPADQRMKAMIARTANEIQKLKKQFESFCDNVYEKTTTLAYIWRTSYSLKEKIIRAVLHMSFGEFCSCTRIMGLPEIYNDLSTLERCYRLIVGQKKIWPLNLYIPLHHLVKYLQSKKVAIKEMSLSDISPKFLHWTDLVTLTNYDECVCKFYYMWTAIEIKKPPLASVDRRKIYYEACWTAEKWVEQVPTIISKDLIDCINSTIVEDNRLQLVDLCDYFNIKQKQSTKNRAIEVLEDLEMVAHRSPKPTPSKEKPNVLQLSEETKSATTEQDHLDTNHEVIPASGFLPSSQYTQFAAEEIIQTSIHPLTSQETQIPEELCNVSVTSTQESSSKEIQAEKVPSCAPIAHPQASVSSLKTQELRIPNEDSVDVALAHIFRDESNQSGAINQCSAANSKASKSDEVVAHRSSKPTPSKEESNQLLTKPNSTSSQQQADSEELQIVLQFSDETNTSNEVIPASGFLPSSRDNQFAAEEIIQTSIYPLTSQETQIAQPKASVSSLNTQELRIPNEDPVDVALAHIFGDESNQSGAINQCSAANSKAPKSDEVGSMDAHTQQTSIEESYPLIRTQNTISSQLDTDFDESYCFDTQTTTNLSKEDLQEEVERVSILCTEAQINLLPSETIHVSTGEPDPINTSIGVKQASACLLTPWGTLTQGEENTQTSIYPLTSQDTQIAEQRCNVSTTNTQNQSPSQESQIEDVPSCTPITRPEASASSLETQEPQIPNENSVDIALDRIFGRREETAAVSRPCSVVKMNPNRVPTEDSKSDVAVWTGPMKEEPIKMDNIQFILDDDSDNFTCVPIMAEPIVIDDDISFNIGNSNTTEVPQLSSGSISGLSASSKHDKAIPESQLLYESQKSSSASLTGVFPNEQIIAPTGKTVQMQNEVTQNADVDSTPEPRTETAALRFKRSASEPPIPSNLYVLDDPPPQNAEVCSKDVERNVRAMDNMQFILCDDSETFFCVPVELELVVEADDTHLPSINIGPNPTPPILSGSLSELCEVPSFEQIIPEDQLQYESSKSPSGSSNTNSLNKRRIAPKEDTVESEAAVIPPHDSPMQTRPKRRKIPEFVPQRRHEFRPLELRRKRNSKS